MRLRRVEVFFHFEVISKTMVLSRSQFSDADQAGVGVGVIAIPEAASPGSLTNISEGIGDELYACGCVGDEHEVIVVRVGTQKSQCLLSDLVDHLC